MRLDSDKSREFLNKYACNLELKIKKSLTNEDIYEKLLELGEFSYVVPNVVLEIVEFLAFKEIFPVEARKGSYVGDLGKSHNDLIIQGVNLLETIRYRRAREVLNLLVTIKNRYKNESINKKVIEGIKKIAEYNYHIISNDQIGLSIQGILLDEVEAWGTKKQLKELEIVDVIVKQILSLDYVGWERKSVNTYTHLTGSISANEFLIKMRKKVRKLILEIYNDVDKNELLKRINVIKMFSGLFRLPMNARDDATKEMILDDLKFVLREYEKIVFPDGNEMKLEFPIIREMENQLLFFRRNKEDYNVSEINQFVKKIYRNEDYKKYLTFIRDKYDMYSDLEDSFSQDDLKRRENEYFNELSEGNLDDLIYFVKEVYSLKEIIEDWHFEPLINFVVKICAEKDGKFVNKFIELIKDDIHLFSRFISAILLGLRNRDDLSLWYKYAEVVQKIKDINSIVVILSLQKNLEKVTEKDIGIIKNILDMEDSPVNWHRNILMDLLWRLRSRGIDMDQYIIKEFKKIPENDYVHLLAISFRIKDEDSKPISEILRKFLFAKIIEVNQIEFHLEVILKELVRDDCEGVLNVFFSRIEHIQKIDEEAKTAQEKLEERYSAIPFNKTNRELYLAIAACDNYVENVVEFVEKVDNGYLFFVSELIKLIGGEKHNEIIKYFIDKGDLDNLKVAYSLLSNFGEPDFNLCLEIVSKTEDEDLLGFIENKMISGAGVYSGDDGMIKIYKDKKHRILKMMDESRSKKIKAYCEKLVSSLDKSIVVEEKRVKEDRRLRQIEFDSE